MIQWEYKVLDFCEDDYEKARAQEQAVLSTWGRLGWKLVSAVQVGGIRRRFYLKRRLASVLPPPATPPRKRKP